MRNGWGDEFTKKMRRRIAELKRESRAAEKDHRPVEALWKKFAATELAIQLSEYTAWRGYARTGKVRGSGTAEHVPSEGVPRVRNEA